MKNPIETPSVGDKLAVIWHRGSYAAPRVTEVEVISVGKRDVKSRDAQGTEYVFALTDPLRRLRGRSVSESVYTLDDPMTVKALEQQAESHLRNELYTSAEQLLGAIRQADPDVRLDDNLLTDMEAAIAAYRAQRSA